MLYRDNFKMNETNMLSILNGTYTSLMKASSSTKSISRKIGQYQDSIGLSGEIGSMS